MGAGSMRFYEYRQSDTSPPKYSLELTSEELEKVKELIIKVIQIIKQEETENERPS